MFWKPDQTGQRNQKESFLARNTHPKETTVFTIDFDELAATLPHPATRTTRPANHRRIGRTRRKRENSPLNFVAIKRRPDRLFSLT
jgi:hypothetical protein